MIKIGYLPLDAQRSNLCFKVINARRGNKGGLISLLDKQGLKVHGVSYTKQQGRKKDVPVVF